MTDKDFARNALAPSGTIDALKDMLEEVSKPSARMHIRKFENFSMELINFIQGKENNVQRWFQVVGGAHTRIEIYDDSNNTVFITPAILNRLPTDNNGNDGVTISQQTNEFHRMLSINPIMATNYLRNQFSKRNVQAIISKEDIDHWNTLLEYYGHPPLDLNPTKTSETESKETEILIDDEEEDELF